MDTEVKKTIIRFYKGFGISVLVGVGIALAIAGVNWFYNHLFYQIPLWGRWTMLGVVVFAAFNLVLYSTVSYNIEQKRKDAEYFAKHGTHRRPLVYY